MVRDIILDINVVFIFPLRIWSGILVFSQIQQQLYGHDFRYIPKEKSLSTVMTQYVCTLTTVLTY